MIRGCGQTDKGLCLPDSAEDSKDMVIKNAKVEDSGVFRCETIEKNPAAINHTLLVTQKPSIVSKPQVHVPRTIVNSDLKIEAVLQCVAHEEASYSLEDKQLQPGEYLAVVKVKNSKSWGGSNEPAVVNIQDPQSLYIQTASVFRENTSMAHSIRPVYSALSTILMYLLVRML
ncbi:hypothetical protein HF086_002600 [Spodoptera exigua]|uniref:Uncharacterized protein n=1 Tax=Spodoptera exigua TaxID=7107 RepID=A0A922MH01_SPOEX|nr:hypothetical protein HF086_002600 [Spodoptera exigua]